MTRISRENGDSLKFIVVPDYNDEAEISICLSMDDGALEIEIWDSGWEEGTTSCPLSADDVEAIISGLHEFGEISKRIRKDA